MSKSKRPALALNGRCMSESYPYRPAQGPLHESTTLELSFRFDIGHRMQRIEAIRRGHSGRFDESDRIGPEARLGVRLRARIGHTDDSSGADPISHRLVSR